MTIRLTKEREKFNDSRITKKEQIPGGGGGGGGGGAHHHSDRGNKGKYMGESHGVVVIYGVAALRRSLVTRPLNLHHAPPLRPSCCGHAVPPTPFTVKKTPPARQSFQFNNTSSVH